MSGLLRYGNQRDDCPFDRCGDTEAGGRAPDNATTDSEHWWPLTALTFLGRLRRARRQGGIGVDLPATNSGLPNSHTSANDHQRREPVVALPDVRPPASQSPHRSNGQSSRWLSERKRPLINAPNREPLTRFVATWAANPRGQPRGDQEWRLPNSREPCAASEQSEISARPQAGLAFTETP